MKYNRMTRRHFLQGIGSTYLALPFMTSLMPKAHAATVPNPKFLVAFQIGHGGVQLQNMYPINSNPAVQAALTKTQLYATNNHMMKVGQLTALKTTMASNVNYLATNVGAAAPELAGGYSVNALGADFDAGAARVSPVIGSFISDALLAKMNLISGLDYMFDIEHNVASLGNFCNGLLASGMNNVSIPTIDSVLAKAAGFYASTPKATSVELNTQNGNSNESGIASNTISMIKSSSGTISANSYAPSNVGQAFNLLFSGLSNTTTTSTVTDPTLAKKSFILNNVYGDYSRVAKGAYGAGRRISSDDRNRLEEFMTNLSSIISGVNPTTTVMTNACVVPSISGSNTSTVTSPEFSAVNVANQQATLALYNQIMASAFACGATQVFVVMVPALRDGYVPGGSPNPTFNDGDADDAHQNLYHKATLIDRQRVLAQGHRFYMQYAFYDLMQKLDAMKGPTGNTLLDQALLFWTNENGANIHSGNQIPIVMAGGAGGAIKTGNYVDYRTTTMLKSFGQNYGPMGIPYNRFLATVLQAMGVPPSGYELPATMFAGSTGRIVTSSAGTVPGYGHPYQNSWSANYPYDYQVGDMSLLLPGIT